MSATERPSAVIDIVGADQPSLELEYKYPLFDTTGESRTVVHSPIGETSVVQHMGAKARKMTMRGHCYRDEAEIIKTFTEYAKIGIKSDGFTGYVVVNDFSIEHTKAKGGKRPEHTHTNKNYRYRLSLTETSAPPPDDSQ